MSKQKKKIFLDLGSHIGEISLYIAKNNPNSKVFSVEGSPTCSRIQKKNILINNINNLYFKNIILSDNNSFEYISDNFGTENYSINHPKKGFVKVKSMKLRNLIKEFNIDYIDFCKIDIEGSIPKLSEDSINLWEDNKVKYCSLSIEKNSLKSYMAILNSFSRNLKIFKVESNFNQKEIISYKYLIENLEAKLGDSYQSNRFQGIEVIFQRLDDFVS